MQKFPTQYQNFIHLSRYSRWRPEDNRRETWEETVARYFDFFEKHLKENCKYELSAKLRNRLQSAILELKVMPSMRALMTAGPALERDHISGYNCAFVAIDTPRSFDEILFILMCGTGCGFSVERQHIAKLPIVADEFHDTDSIIVVRDSKLGWAKALKELITMLYVGQVPKWDLTKLRAAGTPLKTFGGRSGGPAPLNALFNYVVHAFKEAAGRKLTSIECHDIVCKIAEIVVVGGVRRSALLSLSNLSDDRMRVCKSGQWWIDNPQRAMANNSACYTEKPDIGLFMKEWVSLYESRSGERGIFNREAVINQVKKNERRDVNYEFGTNPCSEIILRNREFCNLSEVIIRPTDTEETLKDKIELATILGTFQSTLTNFNYISKEWKNNCDEERLLGVSLTGIMDCKLMNDSTNPETPKLLERLKEHAVRVNAKWSKELGINQSSAITCIKPSGTVSQLNDCASGIHTRHAPYYIRTVRADIKDPLCKFMTDAGFPAEPDVTKPDAMMVFSFPIKVDEGAVFRKDLSAIQQLEMWLMYYRHWCEHKPSITVSVKQDEWMAVGAYVWEHFDEMSGVSFLPYADHIYKQAPYQECTKEQYEELLAKIPQDVDWTKLAAYENNDNTKGAQELACTGNSCEIVDI